MDRLRKLAFLPLLLAWAAGTVAFAVGGDAFAGGVLEQVPRDALGFIVVRNLSESDAKAGKLLTTVGSRLPGMLALLKSVARLDAGLDERRDLMIVLLPPQNNSRQFHLAVWLPTRDYDALVRSLDGDPGRQVAAITLAGEDLLMIHHDQWAVIMDTDQRDRLELLHDAKPSPPPHVVEWSEWIGTLDAAVVVFPAGMRAGWAWAAEEGLLQSATPPVAPAPHDDDLFGPGNRPAPPRGWPGVRHSIRTALATAPELVRWAAEADGAACGWRLDDEGNALVSLRLALAPDSLAAKGSEPDAQSWSPAPRLHADGPFVVVGDGSVSPYWTKLLVAPYVRQQTNGLAAQFDNLVGPDDLANFCRSAEAAAADVSAFSLLTRPGSGADGVYTNNFLALRVASSADFADRAGSLVVEWNAMVGKVAALKPLAFDSRAITVGDRRGREYSIDMTAVAGVPPLPENKAPMEKLFGPGGRFRIQVLAIDDKNVLLAVAVKPQIAELLDSLADQASGAPEAAELQAVQELFGTHGQWQLFFSPRGYTEWLRRQFDAVLGDAIGAPVLPLYPESLPVSVAGGMEGRILWTDVAVPVDTLRGFAEYSRK